MLKTKPEFTEIKPLTAFENLSNDEIRCGKSIGWWKSAYKVVHFIEQIIK
jgi:hypothetical protein